MAEFNVKKLSREAISDHPIKTRRDMFHVTPHPSVGICILPVLWIHELVVSNGIMYMHINRCAQ